MKKIFICIVCLCLSSLLYAQTERKNLIKINPITSFFNVHILSYERLLGSGPFSLSVTGLYASIKKEKINEQITQEKTTNYGFLISLNYHFLSDKVHPAGLYVGPIVGGNIAKSDNAKANIFRAGAIVGYQWIGKKGFVFDLHAGYTYIHVSAESGFASDNTLIVGGNQNAFIPFVGFYIGYAF